MLLDKTRNFSSIQAMELALKGTQMLVVTLLRAGTSGVPCRRGWVLATSTKGQMTQPSVQRAVPLPPPPGPPPPSPANNCCGVFFYSKVCPLGTVSYSKGERETGVVTNPDSFDVSNNISQNNNDNDEDIGTKNGRFLLLSVCFVLHLLFFCSDDAIDAPMI